MIDICYVVGYDLDSPVKIVKVTHHTKIVSAQLLYPYLGSHYKHIWQPKIGTKALVFFSGDNSDGAIVLGFLEKDTDEPVLQFSDEGNKELFQHENGTKVEFTNSDDQKQIKVTTPKEDEINIDLDNQFFEIKSKDDRIQVIFNFKDSKITIKSDELSFEATKSFLLKTPSFKIETSDSIDIESGSFNLNSSKNVDISSTSTLNIKGQSINLN